METTYSIAIKRTGVGDLPELVRAQTPAAAAELVRALLCCEDESIEQVILTVRQEIKPL